MVEVKLCITWFPVILGKATRFVCASKLLLSCYNKGIKIPSSVRRAVFSGLRMSGCFGEARMAKALK